MFIMYKKTQKKKHEALAKCTTHVYRKLVGITQTHSYVGNNNDHYNYSFIVRYEFAGQIYEKEHNSEYNNWKYISPEQSLTILVNPSLYVPSEYIKVTLLP